MKSFYKKRAEKILIPTIFWSVFYLAWMYLKETLKGDAPSIYLTIKQIALGTPYYHMWYLYMIMGLYLFTPFLRLLVMNLNRLELYWFVAVLFVISIINNISINLFWERDSIIFINWFIKYLPYYILGYCVQTSEYNPKGKICMLVFTISVIATAIGTYLLGMLYGFEKGQYFYSYLSITVIPMSISALFLLKKMKMPLHESRIHEMALLSFGIYLVHPLAIEVIGFLGLRGQNYNSLISIPIVSLVVFLCSLLIALIVDKIPYLRRII